MNVRPLRALLAALGFGLVVAGCTEQLTAPGTCPATCPGGTPEVRDTVLDAVVGGDSTYAGFVNRGTAASGLLLANGFLGDTDVALIRFRSRSDSISVRDTARSYVIDSVQISLSVLARDSTASGMKLLVYRVPRTVDTSLTYTQASALLTPAALLDSAAIDDTVHAPHTYTWMYSGADLAKVDIPAADSGVIALGLALSGPTASGIRVGGVASGTTVPSITAYVTVDIPDTTAALKHQTVLVRSDQGTYFPSTPHTLDPDLLTLGTTHGTRVMVRFKFPEYLKDSALISRATLELTPVAPINGLLADSVNLDADAVLADFGAKSPLNGLAGFRPFDFGSADTVRIEVVKAMAGWQNDVLASAPAFALFLNQEGASFAEARFYSTRSPSGRPRLHITYQRAFPFERP